MAKTTKLIAFLILSTLPVACASTLPQRPESASHLYSPSELGRIMALREWGESRANVAKKVGGNRTDVRLAEREELARRREPTKAASVDRSRDMGTGPVLANR